MKTFDLVYSPNEDMETLLFTNLDLDKLIEPVAIHREEPIPEEERIYDKKKSELIDYEDEDYVLLRNKEQEPLVITDVDSRSLAGKFQDMSNNSSMYFVFVNTGESLKMIPISKWYGFVQKNQLSERDVEGLEKNLQFVGAESHETDSEKEIDFSPTFDDDDDEFNDVYISKEKTLSSSGKKIQGLMECYEEDDKPEEKNEEVEEEVVQTAKKQKPGAKQDKVLTKDDIKKAFGGKKISVKDLQLNIKTHFKLEDYEKTLIREFIHENCVFEVDLVTGEKMFKLKK